MNFRVKLESFLRDKYNLMFLGVILIAFVIRLYYFIYTYNQPLWWDEAEYMSMAKNLLYGIPYDFNPQRPILFPLLMSLFLWASEGAVRFFIVFLPSLGVVVLTYLLGKELYDKKIGLISAFFMSVFYLLLFFTYRLLVDLHSLAFFTFSAFLFYRYFKTNSVKSLYLAAVVISIGTMFKLSYSKNLSIKKSRP